MSYVDKALLPGERVVFRTKLHWVIFVGAFLTLLLGLGFLAASFPFWRDPERRAVAIALAGAGVVFLVVGIARGMRPYVRYLTSEFAVTNKRVVVKTGLVRRDTLEMLLTKIEAIAVDQTVGGRILGYGTVTIVGTGGTQSPYPLIRDPLGLRRAVQAQAAPS